ncbi:hypothetical protein EZS27_018119 [termite gut metagenome]|jgi:uncharacterized phage-associated protein|uniref:Antitoxin SocA-like Panacea domain-containing protein n=1 Tax=termite gut metagenome TaxID=433724 RepID=A0A5J4RIN5_9ZZZZ
MKCYSANQISDWILSRYNLEAGDSITPLKLQKLLYYCQAWHYTIFNTPLFKDSIEAWTHGPVVPSQFKRFAHLRMCDNILANPIQIEKVNLEKDTEELLIEVMNIYGQHTAYYLEKLTHTERPWKETRGDLDYAVASNKVITPDLMKEYYSSVNK